MSNDGHGNNGRVPAGDAPHPEKRAGEKAHGQANPDVLEEERKRSAVEIEKVVEEMKRHAEEKAAADEANRKAAEANKAAANEEFASERL